MASFEDKLRDLKEKNNELVEKVQYWKVLAGQRENEKVALMQEINDLRLKLSRLRSNGNVQARNLDAALQSASEKALAHLVRASGEIARTIDLTKAYMREREEAETVSPHWNSIGGSPASAKKNKVHRVPPLMMGGQSLQPVVVLPMLNTSNPRSTARSPDANRNVTERAVPMHMLQDVYIPLTRIDADLHLQNTETEDGNNSDDSSEQIQLNDSEGRVVEESQRMSEDEFESTRVLDAVAEDSEPENDDAILSSSRIENPLEGPSWMLDTDNHTQSRASKSRTNLEPDSTTELETFRDTPPSDSLINKTEIPPQLFSPTVRRRKRTSSPPATPRRSSHYSPRPLSTRRISNSGRVLKVLVAKMRLDSPPTASELGGSPPKRVATAGSLTAFDAPSPNGATVAGVIVSETSQDELESLGSGEPAPHTRRKKKSHHRSHNVQHRTNSTDNTDHSMDIDEEQSRNIEEESSSKETNKRTNRDSKKSKDHERERNRERKRTDNSEQSKQRVNSVERSQRERNDRDHIDRERINSEERIESQQVTSAEHSNWVNNEGRKTEWNNSEERSLDRGDGKRQRERSVERQEEALRTDSRASNDSVSHQDSSGTARSRYTRVRKKVARRGTSGSNARGYDSDSGSGGEREGRVRRTRKLVTYKEKPLNRKMRR